MRMTHNSVYDLTSVRPGLHGARDSGIYPILIPFLEAVNRVKAQMDGGNSMQCAAAPSYNLTFRCIICGRYEASATCPGDSIVSEDQIRARIYRVHCATCGWKGEACGLSAIRISSVPELDPPGANSPQNSSLRGRLNDSGGWAVHSVLSRLRFSLGLLAATRSR